MKEPTKEQRKALKKYGNRKRYVMVQAVWDGDQIVIKYRERSLYSDRHAGPEKTVVV